MWTRGKTLMNQFMILVTLSLVSGCATVSTSAICDGLGEAVDEHTVALVADGGPRSQATGVRLLAGFDGACGL